MALPSLVDLAEVARRPGRLYTTAEVMAVFRLRDRGTVTAWVRAGRLAAKRVGGRLLFPGQAILAAAGEALAAEAEKAPRPAVDLQAVLAECDRLAKRKA